MKAFFYAVLLTALLTGCGTSQPPTPTLKVDDKTVPVVLHGYSWSGGLFTKSTSVAPVDTPPKVAEKNKPAEAPSKAKLSINFKNPPQSLQVELWNGNETRKIPLTDTNSIVLPKEKGVFVYQILAQWENGMASYVFAIEVSDKR
ncbi:putative periplasmic lipoprotein [Effusibacillus pohliae]|uniref:hypothetical protein n=1 Tax=Effusibacillus pohliae TaxID=232270 RepID=UPI0012E9B77E|nr:hypothetical protein [Effusibacillus pohliae]